MSLFIYLLLLQLIACSKQFLNIWVVSVLVGALVKTVVTLFSRRPLKGGGVLGNLARALKESILFGLSPSWLKGFILFSCLRLLLSVLGSRLPPTEEGSWAGSLHGVSIVFLFIILLLLIVALVRWFQQWFQK